MYLIVGSTASRNSSRPSSRASSRAPSVSSDISESDGPEVYTTMRQETRNIAGRPVTTVTYQTHQKQTRTITMPTAAAAKTLSSRIPKRSPDKKDKPKKKTSTTKWWTVLVKYIWLPLSFQWLTVVLFIMCVCSIEWHTYCHYLCILCVKQDVKLVKSIMTYYIKKSTNIIMYITKEIKRSCIISFNILWI